MRLFLCFAILTGFCSCESLEKRLLHDPQFAGGVSLVTHEPIVPKFYRFGDYFFVTGTDANTHNSTLGLYYKEQQILTQNLEAGDYDTIIAVKLNHDDVPDFIIQYGFNETNNLSVMISQSEKTFKEQTDLAQLKKLYVEEKTNLDLVGCFVIKDLDRDGLDDIVTNLARKNNKDIVLPGTDTIYAASLITRK